MKGINKQKTGFKYGRYSLKVLREFNVLPYLGRTYKVVEVEIHTKERYISLRLYNNSGKFIKQFLMEPELAKSIGFILNAAPWGNTKG